MKNTVKIPIYDEVDIGDIIPQIKKLGEICQKVKKYYPSVFSAMKTQYHLDISFNAKTLSEELFDRKIEILLLQDDELR